ncbi:MAG: ATP-binding protein [Polyangiaceae bacterium]
MPLRIASRFLVRGAVRAELLAAGFEVFSAVLFAASVAPVVGRSALALPIFLATILLSALASRSLTTELRILAASCFRFIAWQLAVLPLGTLEDPRLLIATTTFGIMATAMRRAIYRRELSPAPTYGQASSGGADLARWTRGRLGESAAMAGILGGHLLLVFSVAFLRAQSETLFRGWYQFLPFLAVSATLAYTVTMFAWTRELAIVLRLATGSPAGSDTTAALTLQRASDAVRSLRSLPGRLSWLNFSLWVACTWAGVFYFRTGAASWRGTDAVMQLGYATLFSWGVAYYQRGWDRTTTAYVEASLRRFSRSLFGTSPIVDGARPDPAGVAIRERMFRAFGSPLLFAATLMLFSSIALYRSLGSGLAASDDVAAVLALVAAFLMLVLAVGGVIARVANELARPVVQVASAAETVAAGQLDAPVPPIEGGGELARLASSVERMRVTLGRTIAELEQERAGLEAKVEARTTELKTALDELRAAQAALVQGERLASIGELVANLAHEINNPLNAVAGSAEPLEELVAGVRKMLDAYRGAERDLPAARRAKLEELRAELDLDASLDDLVGITTVVRRATGRTVRIVQNLKNFARSTQEAVPADLSSNLEETLVLLGSRLRQSCITVTRSFAELPLVECRIGEINQVFLNLLMNAIQALEGVGDAPREGVSVREIKVETRVRGPHVEIAVSDNGPGVPADLRNKIFDPFFTTKPRGAGTGLGLSISTDIVRKHGGSLSVDRSDEGGARFLVRLPIEHESKQANGRASQARPSSS